MKILYVEDEKNDAVLVSRCLQAVAHEVTVVNNIQEAQRHPLENFHLILVDIMFMHGRDGLLFSKSARQTGYDHPMIAVTALSTQEDFDQCLKAGFTDMLIKPFTVSQLLEKINQYAP